MSKILVIVGSLNTDQVSASRQVAAAFLDSYQVKNPNTTVEMIDATEIRDVALTKNIIAGNIGAYEQGVLEQRRKLLAQFKAADLIVIATPMFNFGLPGEVKEVIDTFAVAGETFKYLDAPDADGNVSMGLTEGKKVIFIQAMGGFNVGAQDVSLLQVKHLFSFLGVKNENIIYIPIQGTAVPGMEETEQRMGEAKELASKLS